MKKTYYKPDMRIVELQHHHQLLAGSGLRTTSTNLDPEDVLEIDETLPTIIWAR